MTNYLLTKQKANYVTVLLSVKEFDSLFDGQQPCHGVMVNLDIWQTCFVHEAGINQLIEETSRLLLAAENGSWGKLMHKDVLMSSFCKSEWFFPQCRWAVIVYFPVSMSSFVLWRQKWTMTECFCMMTCC